MEDKNRELNVDELEQGVGGTEGVRLRDHPQFKQAMSDLKRLKGKGKTRDQVMTIAEMSGQKWLKAVASKYWDEV